MNKSVIPEDWAVVLLGFIIIALSLGGVLLAVPEYSWATSADLTGKVLTAGNLLNIGLQFIYVYIIAIFGALLTGKSVSGVFKGFPIYLPFNSAGLNYSRQQPNESAEP
jgi:hypothetical protein